MRSLPFQRDPVTLQIFILVRLANIINSLILIDIIAHYYLPLGIDLILTFFSFLVSFVGIGGVLTAVAGFVVDTLLPSAIIYTSYIIIETTTIKLIAMVITEQKKQIIEVIINLTLLSFNLAFSFCTIATRLIHRSTRLYSHKVFSHSGFSRTDFLITSTSGNDFVFQRHGL